MVKEISILVNTRFLLLYLLLDIKTFNAVGNPKPAILLRSINVGIIIEYMPIPVVPICLVSTILMTSPRIFVNNPPIIKINVDLINLFFIVQVYSNKKDIITIKYSNYL